MTQSKPPTPQGAGGERPPERYPSVRQDDAVERTGRTQQVAGEAPSFGEPARPDQKDDKPGVAPADNEGRLGPEGDPAEGKR